MLNRFGKISGGPRWQNLVVRAIALSAFVGVLGCGGEKSQKEGGSSDVTAGETVYVQGTVSARGSSPFELLLLQTDDGKAYMIDSSPTANELKRLDGMSVGVTALVLPDVADEVPALSVQRYELLPLPTGERPIIGVISRRSPDEVYLSTDDGSIWMIEGDFKTLFGGFSGAKVWIVGDKGSSYAISGGGAKKVYVTQYGIIRETR